MPLEVLLSDGYAALRRAQIDPAKAWPGMPPAGEVGGVAIPPWRPDPSAGAPLEIAEGRPETSFLCVADGQGNVFAATPCDPTISGPVVPGTGITVSMWGSRGYTGPDHPARVGPGRRPRMSANPAIAIKPGEMVMPFGSPGSEVLGQAMVQVFLNQAVFGMDPQSACEAPRFASLFVAGVGSCRIRTGPATCASRRMSARRPCEALAATGPSRGALAGAASATARSRRTARSGGATASTRCTPTPRRSTACAAVADLAEIDAPIDYLLVAVPAARCADVVSAPRRGGCRSCT